VVPLGFESLSKRARAAAILAGLALVLPVACAQAQTPPPPAPRFEIQRFVVEGNTLMSQPDLDRLMAPFTGKDRDFGDVQRALEALQDAYVQRGFNAVRVSIPEQDIRAGQVRLEVLEAKIRRVRVQNNRFFDEKNVRAGLPSLKEDAAPNIRAISQDALLANENPAKQVSVSLEAAEEPAKVDATVRVTDEKPSRVSAFADNTGTPKTGNLRTGLGYQNANVFNGDNVVNAQAITSPGHVSDVKIFGVGYRAPVYGWGGAVDVVAGYSSVNSGTVQDVFNVSGKGTVFGLRYTQLLGRLDAYEHRLAFGWDHRAYKNDVTFASDPAANPLIHDIWVRPLSLTYMGRVSQVGRDLAFNASFSHNIPGGNNGTRRAFEDQRPEAATDFSIFRAGLAYSQQLPGDFLARAAINAQRTNDLLVPGEQFGMGGADNVRGYYEREAANDNGRRLSLEAYGPDFGARLGNDWRARALIFTDAARGHDNSRDNSPVRNPENTLGSFGLGLRANQGKSFAVRLDAARVTRDAGTRTSGESRVHFALAYSF
jgi:hemolysin activation/secretion protein